LDNLTLHYPNEAARHKLLDVIGDLALIGTKIRGRVIATKPGHFVNTEFAKVMAQKIKKEKRNFVPKFDLNQKPVMDIHQIMAMLPHRPPFLLVDRILEITDSRVVGMKNVTMNEPFFVGHFPDAPVMPGVLQVEAMAQAGGILALSTVPDPENYLTFFMKIDKVRFKQQVLPGDTLIFDLNLITPIRRGICHMLGKAYANGKLVSEAELMAQMVKTKNPFTTIHGNVIIGEGTWIGSNVTIMEGARIGKNCSIFPGAVISAVPQDKKFNDEDTVTIIGDNTTIRECVTVNRGSADRMKTQIGNDCWIMAYSHIAHDCIVGNNCIFSNNTTLAGHITIGDYVVCAGMVAINQFCSVGNQIL